jgi:hypothetical protein
MMGLRKLIELPPSERWLLIRVAVLVVAVRLALALLPWRAVHRLVARAARPAARANRSSPVPVDHLRWPVEATSRRVPGAVCLTQALALQILLGRRGLASELRLGVSRGEGPGLEAHAWLESEGRILIGAAERERYAAFPSLRRP